MNSKNGDGVAERSNAMAAGMMPEAPPLEYGIASSGHQDRVQGDGSGYVGVGTEM